MKTIFKYSLGLPVIFTVACTLPGEEKSFALVPNNVVKIGVLLDLSGDVANQGAIGEAVAKLAAEDLKKEGINVELIIKDTARDPDETDAVIHDLARQGVHLVAGPQTSDEAVAASKLANEHGLILISPSSTSPTLAIANDNLLRLAPTDVAQARAIAREIKRDQRTCLVSLTRADVWGTDLQTEIESAMGEEHSDIAYDPNISSSAPVDDFTESLEQLTDYATACNDVNQVAIQLAAFEEVAYALIGAARMDANDPNKTLSRAKWYGSDGFAGIQALVDNPDFREAARFAAEVGLEAPIFTVDEQSSKRYETWKERLHNIQLEPTIYEGALYDAIFLLAKAADKLGESNTNIEEVRNTLIDLAQSTEGVTGNLAFDKNGDRANVQYDFYKIIAKNPDGTFTCPLQFTTTPEEWKTHDFIWCLSRRLVSGE